MVGSKAGLESKSPPNLATIQLPRYELCTRKKKPPQRLLEGRSGPKAAPTIVHEVLRFSGRPLDASTRVFFEPRFGHDFSRVQVHTDGRSAESAQMVNARAYTVGNHLVFDRDAYQPNTSAGRLLLAHELTHIVQQSAAGSLTELGISEASSSTEEQAKQNANAIIGGHSAVVLPRRAAHLQVVMRDLALEPPGQVPEQRELSSVQEQAAINYNHARYNEESARLIQDIVGAPQTGHFDRETVRLIALIQRQFGLLPADGKVGPDTFDFLISELQAEGITPDACLTMFQLTGPQPLQFSRISSTTGSISSRHSIRARFDPRCNCSDYEYRQYIFGHVQLIESAQSGVTPPPRTGCAVLASTSATNWVWNLDGCFQIPGGGLRRNMVEDGDATVSPGVAGHRYGHRSARPNPSAIHDRYLPDRDTGCIYEAFDVPELTPIPASLVDTGDVYDWNMNFRGIIQKKDGTVVSEKWWSIIRRITIP